METISMPANKSSEDKFDQMLVRALRQHSESAPAGFTQKISEQIRKADEQVILARVAMKEKLALAGCIALGAVSIIMAISFPGAAGAFTQQLEAFLNKISQIPKTLTTVRWAWQYYVVFAGVFGYAVYHLTDLLVGDSL
jgi:hypothetical protein